MRYLGLAEGFIIAEAVTGIPARVLTSISRRELLDSAVLCVRIAKNHPLPDGNKRLAWMAMVVFLDLNNAILRVDDDDAVQTMLAVASGEINENALTTWLSKHVQIFEEKS